MSTPELTVLRVPPVTAPSPSPPAPSAAWRRAAGQARILSWASLAWMTIEGVVGVIAGLDAGSIGVVSWAIGSVVEGLAAVIVVWRLTGSRVMSSTSERRAQRAVGASFFLFVPYILFEVVHKLITGAEPQRNWVAIGVLASSVVLMPALGWAKLRLGRRLDSGATSGEGVANLICAGQALVGLVGVLIGSAGLGFLDPVAALVISAIAIKEGRELWRGEECGCHAMPGMPTEATVAADGACSDDCCTGAG